MRFSTADIAVECRLWCRIMCARGIVRVRIVVHCRTLDRVFWKKELCCGGDAQVERGSMKFVLYTQIILHLGHNIVKTLLVVVRARVIESRREAVSLTIAMGIGFGTRKRLKIEVNC